MRRVPVVHIVVDVKSYRRVFERGFKIYAACPRDARSAATYDYVRRTRAVKGNLTALIERQCVIVVFEQHRALGDHFFAKLFSVSYDFRNGVELRLVIDAVSLLPVVLFVYDLRLRVEKAADCGCVFQHYAACRKNKCSRKRENNDEYFTDKCEICLFHFVPSPLTERPSAAVSPPFVSALTRLR